MQHGQAPYQSNGRPSLWQRTKWHRYTLLTGLVIGIFLGWLLHGVITFIVKFALVAVVLAVLIALFFVWRAYSHRSRRKVTLVTWQDDEVPSWRDPTR